MMDGKPNLINGLSVVIPAYNEEEAIKQVVHAVARTLNDARIEPYEIIVVDDGSSDTTSRAAQTAGATVLRHPHNLGYGHALKRGIRNAKFDLIAILDGDGTYPEDRLPRLLELYGQGFDMVVGLRSKEFIDDTAVKRPLRRLLRFIVEYAAGRKVPDVNSGLRVFSRATAMEHFPHLCDTFSFTTSLTLAYMMNGRFVAYEPIEYGKRIGKTRVRLFRDSLRTLQYITQCTIYFNPLKLFLLVSMLCFSMAVVVIALAIAFQIASGFFLGVGIILVGLLIGAMGLLADLLRQIMGK